MIGNLYIYQVKNLILNGRQYNSATQKFESVFNDTKSNIEQISQERFSDMFLIRDNNFYENVKKDLMEKGITIKAANGGNAKIHALNLYKSWNIRDKKYHFIFGINTSIEDIRNIYNQCKNNRDFAIFEGSEKGADDLRKAYSSKKIRQFGIINGSIKEMKPKYTEQELLEKGEQIYPSRKDIRYIIDKNYTINHIDKNNNFHEYTVQVSICGLNIDKDRFISLFNNIKRELEKQRLIKEQDESGKYIFCVYYDARNDINGGDKEFIKSFKTRSEAQSFVSSANAGQLECRYSIEPRKVG